MVSLVKKIHAVLSSVVTIIAPFACARYKDSDSTGSGAVAVEVDAACSVTVSAGDTLWFHGGMGGTFTEMHTG